jgi:protease I
MPAMPGDRPLADLRLLMFVADMYEDLELWYPRLRLSEAGAAVTMAGLEKGAVYHSKHGYPCQADVAIQNVDADEFNGLVIPGGYAPDKLRTHEEVKQLVRDFVAQGKLVAAICHAGWIPASAGVLDGVRVTSWPTIRDDLMNAGARWEDAPVVVDGHFVTSRKPDDLPEFCRAIIESLAAVTAA